MVAVSLKKKNFFQAEDGIRGVERSRGLGDVYKRQILLYDIIGFIKKERARERERERKRKRAQIMKNNLFSPFTTFAEMVIDIYTGT